MQRWWTETSRSFLLMTKSKMKTHNSGWYLRLLATTTLILQWVWPFYVHCSTHQLNLVLLHHTGQAIQWRPGSCLTFCKVWVFLLLNQCVNSAPRNLGGFAACAASAPSVDVQLWDTIHSVPADDVQGLSVCRVRAGRHKHLWSQTASQCDTGKTLRKDAFC